MPIAVQITEACRSFFLLISLYLYCFTLNKLHIGQCVMGVSTHWIGFKFLFVARHNYKSVLEINTIRHRHIMTCITHKNSLNISTIFFLNLPTASNDTGTYC